MASKKQMNDIENAVVILEERLERMEEEHAMMKQMLTMQNALIDNLQMVVKMVSTQTTATAHAPSIIVGGGGGGSINSQFQPEENEPNSIIADESNKKTNQLLKHRMARVF